jgi:RNA polymerase sigma-70 factor, ECF subfamily
VDIGSARMLLGGPLHCRPKFAGSSGALMIANDDPGKAFTRLWVAHSPRTFAYIHALVPNWADAEEVLQETGVVLWEKFGQFDRDSDFGRWACRVAYFEVLKQRTRAAASKRRFSDAFLALLAERAAVITDAVPPLQEGLNRCVEELSPSDRRLLALRYDADATTNLVAVEVGRTSRGVRKSLRRIHRVLFECIERWRRQEEHS